MFKLSAIIDHFIVYVYLAFKSIVSYYFKYSI